MNFYEFNDFSYYALIGAKSKEKAIKYYEENVCDVEDGDGEPLELTKEDAKAKLSAAVINEDRKEAMIEFKKYTSGIEPYLILIDGCLI